MCPGCWALRAAKVEPQAKYSGTALQTTGLVMGAIAVLPIPAIQIGAVVVNIIALVKAKEGPAYDARWKAKLGLGLACLGVLLDVVFISLLVR